MGKGTIGIIGAMDNEIELLKRSMDVESTETLTGMTFYRGTIGGRPVVLVRCGIGKVNAAICAQTLIACFGAASIVNTGIAGTLRPDVSIGDIVVSTDAVQHDMDCTSLGYPRGMILYSDMRFFTADALLRQSAVQAAWRTASDGHVVEGRICSGDQFIADDRMKELIAREFDGACCDMESAAIAQACTLNEIPFVIIRVISDSADDSGRMSYEFFQEQAARHSASIVCELARLD
jgi:adenosylhomocysteine nucleosidase